LNSEEQHQILAKQDTEASCFFIADNDLIDAAQSEGLSTDNPN